MPTPADTGVNQTVKVSIILPFMPRSPKWSQMMGM